MPWKVCNVMSQREEFVRLAQVEGCNFSQLCRQFGISRDKGYKWCRRYRDGGRPALADRCRRPHHSPRQVPAATEAAVQRVWEQHPAWGGRKLRRLLQREAPQATPAASTITQILRRRGLLTEPAAAEHGPWQRFERSQPNELWQMDFKGHVGMLDGQRCHPLTILDDHSRFSLCLQACGDEQTPTVQAALIGVFERYGLPRQILCDNGPPWGNGSDQPYTLLGVWLLRQGVRVSHGRAYHPQTQGKDERYHRTLNQELLQRVTLVDQADAQRQFDAFREQYNLVRPHEALGLEVPASRYRLSPRAYQANPPAVDFEPGDVVRKADAGGKISYRGQSWRIGQAFAAQRVGLRSGAEKGVVQVIFCGLAVGRLDLTGPTKAMSSARPSVAPLPVAGHCKVTEPVTHVSEQVSPLTPA